MDGKPPPGVGESYVFGGLPETDAFAFNALYESLASQARAAFAVKHVQAAEESTRIAVSFRDEARSGIYVINSDGTEKQRWTRASSDMLPRWSPDGTQIGMVFQWSLDRNSVLYRSKVDTYVR